MCQVTSSRRAALHLSQGNVKVSCTLKLAFMEKIKTLLTPSFCPGSTELAKAVHTSSAK